MPTIINPYPTTISNGQLADASVVMSIFNYVLTQVNLNGAATGANSDITSLQNVHGSGNIATNTSVGTNALGANTTGFGTTAVGVSAAGANLTGQNNTAVGYQALLGNTTGSGNTAIGEQAIISGSNTGSNNTAVGITTMIANTTGATNTAIGASALNANTTGSTNTAVGGSALLTNQGGTNNVAVGYLSLSAQGANVNANTAVGVSALANVGGSGSTAVGYSAGSLNVGGNNTFVGYTAGQGVASGSAGNCVAVGYQSLIVNNGTSNTAVGAYSCLGNTTGILNTALGAGALQSNATGGNNTAIGANTLSVNVAISQCTAVGFSSLEYNSTGTANSALGYNALSALTTFSDCTGLGSNTAVTGSSQVQLGDSATTTYAYGAVQNRSDLRDKTSVRPTTLGLAFINALKPVDFIWDMRDFYKPAPPADMTDEAAVAAWITSCDLGNITQQGTKKRERYHHGLIAQDVQALIASTGVDFGGFKDHAKDGGQDVYSLGYEEFIAPLIAAVQQLSAQVAALQAAAVTTT